MKTTSRLAPWIAIGAAALAAPAPAAEPAQQGATIPVAHSALLIVDATKTPDGLALHVEHAGNRIPIDGQDVKVTVDGKEQLITPQPQGTFLLATRNLSEGERRIDVTVGHDGIHETLTGTITIPKADSGAGLSSSHSQMAWWILNVVIVLVAVLAISRRKPAAREKEDDEEAE
ncbi:MAG TPA: hypothetical protein VHB68_05575 [Steroidobacteraceae bacterium]|nr:hypothetical protein [Steroidobacteraceae bacterium]